MGEFEKFLKEHEGKTFNYDEYQAAWEADRRRFLKKREAASKRNSRSIEDTIRDSKALLKRADAVLKRFDAVLKGKGFDVEERRRLPTTPSLTAGRWNPKKRKWEAPPLDSRPINVYMGKMYTSKPKPKERGR